MEAKCQNSDLDPKYLLSQLNTARKEINNLRQQVRNLRYMHEKDVDSIKRLLGSCTNGKEFCTSGPTLSRVAQPSTSSDADESLKLKPIGMISTWFPSKRATPRQPGICGQAPGKLTLFNSVFTNPEHALQGLQDFSHMWILFHFHRNDSTHVRAKVAPPRLNGARTGVFSTRSPHRPCPIGLSLVRIVKIENCTIFFEGVDMVDQTPVLDIKPYIPQYDNPLHIEKSNTRELENHLEDGESLGSIDQRLDTNLRLDFNHRLSATNLTADFNDGLRSLLQESYHVDSPDEAARVTDVSRDEEIALRLQAEEFDGSPNSESYSESRTYFPLTDNFDSTDVFEDDRHVTYISRNLESDRDRSNGVNPDSNAQGSWVIMSSEATVPNHREGSLVSGLVDLSSQNSRNDSNARNSDSQTEHIRLQSLNLNSQANRNTTYILRHSESSYLVDQTAQNSRLLDGADGSSTVHTTDLDLIHRRTMSSRLDNSPIRMGVREAPDGEEGLESQSLVSPQTVPNNLSIGAPDSESTENVTFDQNTGAERQDLRTEHNPPEVRVPDWISRPRVSTLSVIFNERALVQLTEILGEKADEQKRAIESVLREDPRSVYLRQRWGNQFYTFLIHELHISCRFDDNRGVVTVFQVRHAGRTCECGVPEWQCLGHSPLS